MRNLRSPVVLQLLCTAVIAVACLGVFSTGAWAFNSWITRTPVETLTYGTFTATLDDLPPDDDGQCRERRGRGRVGRRRLRSSWRRRR